MSLLSPTAAAREAPDAAALVAGERFWTWSRLAEEAVGLLSRLGVREDLDEQGELRVAFEGDASLEAVVATCALAEIGATAVPLHPRWPEEVRRRVLESVRPALVLEPGWLGEKGADAAKDPGSRPASDDRERRAPELGAPERRAPGDERQARPPGRGIDPERALALIHTSGSSGVHKGVVLSRRAFLASARASAANLGWKEDDRWLLDLPTAHVGGFSVVARCLAARRAIVLAEPRGSGFSARGFADAVERRRVTLASLVPTMLRRLLDLEPLWTPPAHLRAVLLGGAPASPALLAEAIGRGLPVLPTYGLTEACSQVATRRLAGLPAADAGEAEIARWAAGGVGRPLPGIEVDIDGGEILVRGATLMSGYLPAGATPSPIDGDGWLHTGDSGRIDSEGRLHPLGRRGEMILSGGENVWPQAVERALEQHPAIRAACVVGLPDQEWGQLVAAALVAADGAHRPGDDELRAFLAPRLARYELPRRIRWLDQLPLGATGKVDRQGVEHELLSKPSLSRERET